MRPTSVRFGMIALTTLVAVMLYLDRICLSTVGEQLTQDQRITKPEYDQLLGAFFITYALFQLPAGWLGDRYGPRTMLSLYLFFWSACTGAMGLVSGFASLLVLRLGCGLFEAGAYPLAAGIVRRWIPFSARGKASGCVAVGGRLGGAIAPLLTAFLAAGALDGWRRPFLWYGLVGMGGAVVFWVWYRNRPEEHPAVNAAEVDLISAGVPPIGSRAHGMPPLLAFCGNLSLWLNSLVQFLTNVAWVILVTKFPAYLKDVFNTSLEMQARYQSLPLAAGIVGMLLGGWMTDVAARAFGQRWGRAVPIAATRAIVGLAYVVLLLVADPLSATVVLCVVSFATDAGNAPLWAYAQDVGGRHVGAVMGWANMWGNLGAGVTPMIFGWILSWYPDNARAGWAVVFLVCALSQVIATLAALGIDCRHPIPGTER